MDPESLKALGQPAKIAPEDDLKQVFVIKSDTDQIWHSTVAFTEQHCILLFGRHVTEWASKKVCTQQEAYTMWRLAERNGFRMITLDLPRNNS